MEQRHGTLFRGKDRTREYPCPGEIWPFGIYMFFLFCRSLFFFFLEPSGWEIEPSLHKSRSANSATAQIEKCKTVPLHQEVSGCLGCWRQKALVHGIYQPCWQTRWPVAYPGPNWACDGQPVRSRGVMYRPSRGQLGFTDGCFWGGDDERFRHFNHFVLFL